MGPTGRPTIRELRDWPCRKPASAHPKWSWSLSADHSFQVAAVWDGRVGAGIRFVGSDRCSPMIRLSGYHLGWRNASFLHATIDFSAVVVAGTVGAKSVARNIPMSGRSAPPINCGWAQISPTLPSTSSHDRISRIRDSDHEVIWRGYRGRMNRSGPAAAPTSCSSATPSKPVRKDRVRLRDWPGIVVSGSSRCRQRRCRRALPFLTPDQPMRRGRVPWSSALPTCGIISRSWVASLADGLEAASTSSRACTQASDISELD